jgi:hypothetical protein
VSIASGAERMASVRIGGADRGCGMIYDDARRILEECAHEGRTSEVRMGGGRTINVCTGCWNQHVAARRQARKAELADDKATIRDGVLRRMVERGVTIGDRVELVVVSFLGPFGPVGRYTGRIIEYRGYIRVACDSPVPTQAGPRRYVDWSPAWERVG